MTRTNDCTGLRQLSSISHARCTADVCPSFLIVRSMPPSGPAPLRYPTSQPRLRQAKATTFSNWNCKCESRTALPYFQSQVISGAMARLGR